CLRSPGVAGRRALDAPLRRSPCAFLDVGWERSSGACALYRGAVCHDRGLMSAPVIRAMTTGDAAAVADLCNQLGYPVEPPRLAKRFAEVVDRGHASVFVAEIGGGVVGWIHVAITPMLEMD